MTALTLPLTGARLSRIQGKAIVRHHELPHTAVVVLSDGDAWRWSTLDRSAKGRHGWSWKEGALLGLPWAACKAQDVPRVARLAVALAYSEEKGSK